MSTPDRVRRCAILMIAIRWRVDFTIEALLRGDASLRRSPYWVVLAPHAGNEIEVTIDEIAALGAIDSVTWSDWTDLVRRHDEASLRSLLGKTLLIGDHEEHSDARRNDDTLRATHWHPLAAVSHYFSRWDAQGFDEDVLLTRHRTIAQLVAEHGPAPPHVIERVASHDSIPLPPPARDAFDSLLEQRATCRNFERTAMLDLRRFSQVMKRVAGCHAEIEAAPGSMILKKSNPSGGSLHSIDFYVVIRNVEGLQPGLYHYHVTRHALKPLATVGEEEVHEKAKAFVAGQFYFADAQVLVALVPRFVRMFWKYRYHPKVYRAIVMEAGHIAQNFYLAATAAGLGAWVTAAINELQIDKAFGLDAVAESAIAVCGFGIRADECRLLELDPLHQVWPPAASDQPARDCRLLDDPPG